VELHPFKTPLSVSLGVDLLVSYGFCSTQLRVQPSRGTPIHLKEKDVCTVYKHTPVKNAEGKLLGIISNLYNEGSTPAIVKLHDNEVGSCFAIQKFDDIAKEFCLEIFLTANMVKETDWGQAMTKIAIIATPTLIPLPFGKEIG
jgi:hypothetical protein